LSETKKDTPVYGEWYYGPEKFLLLNYQFEDRSKTKISDQIRLVAASQMIEESRMTRSFGSSKKTHRKENVKVYSLNLDLKKLYKIHEIRYGFEYAFNQVNSTAYSENIQTKEIGSASTRYPDGGSSMSWFGFYVNVNQEISSKWVLSEGIRINQTKLKSTFNDKTFYEFLPNLIEQKNISICSSLGLVYLAGKQSKIYVNIGNAFRTPNIDDMGKVFDSKSGSAMIVPNSELKPEQTLSGEIGTILSLSNTFSVEANVFYTQLWDALTIAKTRINGLDQLTYDGKLTPVYSVQNAQNAFLYGGHLQVALLLPVNLKLKSSVNYTYGRILSDSLMPLDHIAPIFGRTSLNYQHKKIQASLYMMYSGAKKLEDYYLNGEDNLQYATANGMPAWHTLNIQSAYTFTKKSTVQLSVGIENIFDKNYRVFSSGISSAGRNFWVNLRINF
jgi:hemoglobin/transferrin/lactoferrin receptor protein